MMSLSLWINANYTYDTCINIKSTRIMISQCSFTRWVLLPISYRVENAAKWNETKIWQFIGLTIQSSILCLVQCANYLHWDRRLWFVRQMQWNSIPGVILLFRKPILMSSLLICVFFFYQRWTVLLSKANFNHAFVFYTQIKMLWRNFSLYFDGLFVVIQAKLRRAQKTQ